MAKNIDLKKSVSHIRAKRNIPNQMDSEYCNRREAESKNISLFSLPLAEKVLFQFTNFFNYFRCNGAIWFCVNDGTLLKY